MGKYKIVNKRLTGGKIPEIINMNIQTTSSQSTSNQIDYNPQDETKNNLIKYGPLYFNNRFRINDNSGNQYKYDFGYDPNNYLIIDNNLELTIVESNKKTQPNLDTGPDLYDINRIIIINGLEIPYYLGQLHNKKDIFGKLRLLFEYKINNPLNTDPNRYDFIIFKQEKDIIEFLDSLFTYDVLSGDLLTYSYRLNNQIDKYIFINKFYELLEMILINPDDFVVNEEELTNRNFSNIEDKDLKNLNFVNIKVVEDKNFNNKFRDTDFNSYDFTKLINNYMNQKEEFEIKFCKNYLKSNKSNPETKFKYLQMLKIIDYVLTKLKNIFVNQTSSEEQINLINLVDLYDAYGKIFLNETSKNNYNIEKNMEIINRINDDRKQQEDLNNIFKELIGKETLNICKLILIYNKIKKWPINSLVQNIDLGIIFLLSYFDLRVNSSQIKKGQNLNALPINKNRAYFNLFGNDRSTISNNEVIINTTLYMLPTDNYPDIQDYTPTISLPNYGNFPACVENSIFQIVKILFWNIKKNVYDNTLGNLPINNLLRKFVSDRNNFDFSINKDFNPNTKSNNKIIADFVSNITNLPNIQYMKPNTDYKNNNHELNATPENVVKILLYYLETNIAPDGNVPKTTSGDTFNNDLKALNKLLENFNYTAKVNDIRTNTKSFMLCDKQNKTILTLELTINQHGKITKNVNNINYDVNKLDNNLINLINYLTQENDMDLGILDLTKKYKADYIQGIQDINIETDYFNKNNIYWLNFTSIYQLFYKFCIEIKKIFKLNDNFDLNDGVSGNISNHTSNNTSNNINNNINNNTSNNVDNNLFNLLLEKYIDIIQHILFEKNNKSKNIINNNIINSGDLLFLLCYKKTLNNFDQNIFNSNILDIQNNYEYIGEKINLLQYYCLLLGIYKDAIFYNFFSNDIYLNLLETIKNFDLVKLFDYNISIMQRPINIILTTYSAGIDNNNVSFYSINKFDDTNSFVQKIFNSLIDEKQYVLYQMINNNFEELKYLPIYLSIEILFNIKKFHKQIKFYNQNIINKSIDQQRNVLKVRNENSPVIHYFNMFIDEFNEVPDLDDISKDSEDNQIVILDILRNIINEPIEQLNYENIWTDNNKNYSTIYLLCKELYKKSKSFNSFLKYTTRNKLLIDNTINYNQPVFNVIPNENDMCLLSMYMEYPYTIECECFKYLYNKELLNINYTPPLYSYFYAFYKRYNNGGIYFDLNYIKLLSRPYNNIYPLNNTHIGSLINEEKYALEYLLEIIKRSILDNIQNVVSRKKGYRIDVDYYYIEEIGKKLSDDDFYEVINFLSKNSTYDKKKVVSLLIDIKNECYTHNHFSIKNDHLNDQSYNKIISLFEENYFTI